MIDVQLESLHALAEAGDAEAQFLLAARYQSGDGCDREPDRAVVWYARAAQSGHLRAEYALAHIYLGCARRQRGAELLRRAAERGLGAAQLDLARLSRDAGNAAEWRRWAEAAALQDVVEAELELGAGYRDGRPVERDADEAERWFRRAAERGDARAELQLGELLRSLGRVEEGLAFIKRAAGRRLPEGLNALGLCYHDGVGVERDYTYALFYFREAAALGLADAEFRVGLMHEAGVGTFPNPNEAALWYGRAAARGHVAARLAHEDLLKRTRKP